jgi:hypothetical protein
VGHFRGHRLRATTIAVLAGVSLTTAPAISIGTIVAIAIDTSLNASIAIAASTFIAIAHVTAARAHNHHLFNPHRRRQCFCRHLTIPIVITIPTTNLAFSIAAALVFSFAVLATVSVVIVSCISASVAFIILSATDVTTPLYLQCFRRHRF